MILRTLKDDTDAGRLTDGGWKSAHEIPADRGFYGTSQEVSDKNKVGRLLMESSA